MNPTYSSSYPEKEGSEGLAVRWNPPTIHLPEEGIGGFSSEMEPAYYSTYPEKGWEDLAEMEPASYSSYPEKRV